jgi:hypothetical protein
MYSISEAAKLIGVSRQSIYNKIDKENLQQYIKETDKGKVITDKGFTILKRLFSEYIDSKSKVIDSQDVSQSTDNQEEDIESNTTQNTIEIHDSNTDNSQESFTNDMTLDYINSLKEEKEHLKSIISDQGQQIANLTRLLENSQVLLKQQQDKIILLESPEPKEKPSLWNWFKRN